MRVAFLSTLAAFVIALFPSSLRAGERAPISFTNELAAFTNGLKVLAALTTGGAQSKAVIAPLIGSRVLFQGDNWNRPYGTNADLNLGNGVLLRVAITPHRDVRPRAGMWWAEVVGVLESVDPEKRVIQITARPEDWYAYRRR